MRDSTGIRQISLGAVGFGHKIKRTRKREFPDEISLIELAALIAPHTPKSGAKGGRPSFAVETMLRLHFLQ